MTTPDEIVEAMWEWRDRHLSSDDHPADDEFGELIALVEALRGETQ